MLMIVIELLCGISLTDSISIPAELPNLALGKPAYQINDRHGAVAGRAVDGNLDPDFRRGKSCSQTWHSRGAWWDVNLGDVYRIDTVRIYNTRSYYVERLRDVQVFIGLDRASYVLRSYHPGTIRGSAIFKMNTTVYGQWVLITRDGDILEKFHLCEVQVYGNNYRKGFQLMTNQTGIGQVLKTTTAPSGTHCCTLCLTYTGCAAVNYNNVTGLCDVLATNISTAAVEGQSQLYNLL